MNASRTFSERAINRSNREAAGLCDSRGSSLFYPATTGA
ncbi:hypothetical protein CP97_14673 [Aurantiacibacter atlanticus]|uniref:Uncharacterized protein n=1 Tax=Aurantiacibacter atlanticus TaxID=1648404 RepID=A0A161J472_9SPHN|nr:hypothetical protein CP97_14673 [Aurantiacibacter atlanticus]